MSVQIPHRFHGPLGSVNGGYACGVTASVLAPAPAEVRLRRPPPLERSLELTTADGVATLADGDTVIAEARVAEGLSIEPPSPISLEEATRAANAFDVAAYHARHPFPSCFTCGPGRTTGDGLRIFPARTDREQVIAWPWIPDASLDDGSGSVARVFVWAALDCPSGLPWFHDPHPPGPHVLGSLAAEIHRTPRVGEPVVAAGWLRAVDGRKRHSGSVLWAADGSLLAAAHATWVGLTAAQFAEFQVAAV